MTHNRHQIVAGEDDQGNVVVLKLLVPLTRIHRPLSKEMMILLQ